MTLPAEKRRYTVEEYLRLERDSTQKHEFHDGEILAMSGGSLVHSLISSNVSRAIGNRLKDGKVYDCNLRVFISQTRRYVYPDAAVVRSPQFDPADVKRETVINPRVIVEVTSPLTYTYDCREKFDNYRLIASLREYALISHAAPRVDLFFRQFDGTWAFTAFAGINQTARLRSIQVDLPLAEAFAGVEFPPPPPIPSPEDSKHG